jgi:hypothetical protein
VNLTDHFTLEELVASQLAARRRLDNRPGPAELANLRRVAALLEQIRALVGGPLTVSSGYRSPAVNAAVGGARNSAHLQGLAADITAPGIAPKALAALVRDSDIQFDQLIYEGTWVHVGLSAGALRREVLTATFAPGGVVYSQGIR